MAIGRISGPMLKSNLERLGVDIAIETSLLYVDVTNNRIGINEASPTQSLQVDNVTIASNQIRSTSGTLAASSATNNQTVVAVGTSVSF